MMISLAVFEHENDLREVKMSFLFIAFTIIDWTLSIIYYHLITDGQHTIGII